MNKPAIASLILVNLVGLAVGLAGGMLGRQLSGPPAGCLPSNQREVAVATMTQSGILCTIHTGPVLERPRP